MKLGELAANQVGMILEGRISFDRQFKISAFSHDKVAIFKPTENEVPSFDEQVENDPTILTLEVNSASIRELRCQLKPKKMKFDWPGLANVSLEVVHSEVKDSFGNVVRTVG